MINTIEDQQIKEWLESRTWLFPQGHFFPDSEIFYPIPKEYVKYCEKDEEFDFPYYVFHDFEKDELEPKQVETIYLENARSNCFTWAFPCVVLKIWGGKEIKENQGGKYEIEMYFCYLRGETHYECVANLFVKNFDELMFVMRASGIHENYITGCQAIECK